ncbi:MAG TPA: response regulator, partial [Ornithinibacter sp.]|nr:response regulator [Ornithinibacter sp.]
DDVGPGALEPVPDAVIEVDSGGGIAHVDPQAERLFGWPAPDLIGRRVDVLVADRLGEPGPRPPGVDLRLSARRRDGSLFPAEIRLGPATAQGDGSRVSLAIRDTTATPGSTEEPPSTVATELDLADVAHGLNNVLSVMLIYSELIERAVKDRSMDDYLGEIRAAADRGAALTGQIRNLAQRTAGRPSASETAAAAATATAHPRVDEELLQAIRRHAAPEPRPDPVGVVVVDDHRMFAEGLARLLALEGDIEVLGVGGNGHEAVALVERLRPRVLLLDFDMPEGNGVVAAREVKASRPETMIVMISGSTDDRLILRAVEAGCSGYLTKDRAAAEVAYAVRAVAAGEALMSPAQMARLLPRLEKSFRGMGSDLTERERDVLELLARGATNPAIAAELGVDVDTVHDDVEGVLGKLGAHSKLEAVATAIREGVIEYNSPF